MRIWPGRPYPLGATWDANGVNFALYAENATAVDLCLFDSADATKEAHRLRLTEHQDRVWHCFLPDGRPGQLYGYRVHGPYEPARGHRFNPNKVVLDPYAKAVGRDVKWCDEMWGYRVGDPATDLSFDDRDNAHAAALATVIEPAFTWGDDRPPHTPWHKTVIYEVHVKGFTKLHPEVPENQRGTYAGMTSPAALDHLVRLGVTAVELMPVHDHLDDRHLVNQGKVNYWGYNTLAFFAPESQYSSSRAGAETVREFKTMVRALHTAGIEVILDVVYNHTVEGNHLGPTLTFRGIDNAAYYRLADDPRYYTDFTGCGNTFNMRMPRVLQLIMDSLRYWVTEMHVDGFRFDLASALARELFEVNQLGAFFDIIHQDPILSQVKLIAEPWDVGPGGYQVGNFPSGWSEWNGKFRDTVRRFWKGDGGLASEFATRLCGSADLYERSGRRPYASINFVTCHDGFTLQDLVSYNSKHNEANGEDNRDGADQNDSWNCGAEGASTDPSVNALREQRKRNFIATLMLSQGVPMLLAGDELGKTQNGNNNAYCQDNELTWLNWNLDENQRKFLDFTRGTVALRKLNPVFQRSKFFHGRSIRGKEVTDIHWFGPDGKEMTDDAWHAGFTRCLGMRLDGHIMGEIDDHGDPVTGDTMLLILNAHHEPISYLLPAVAGEHEWEPLLDTALPPGRRDRMSGGVPYDLHGRSTAVLRLVTRQEQKKVEENYVAPVVLEAMESAATTLPAAVGSEIATVP